QQEPGDPGAEAATTQTSFVQALHAGAASPSRGHETHDRDEQEEGDQHGQRDTVDSLGVSRRCKGQGVHRPTCRSGLTPLVIGRCGRAFTTSRYEAYVQAEHRNTHRNWYQMKKGKPPSLGSTLA